MSLDSAISALVSRLETVTARLEKVEGQLASGASVGGGSGGHAAAAGGSDGGSSQSVQEYDSLINQYIRPYVESSGKLDASVKNQAELVLKAVEAQKQFLAVAASSKKPDDKTLQTLFAPTLELMNQISGLKDNRSKFFNNLATVAEGIPALSWVLVTPTPGPHVNDIRPGSEFYSNRILKEFKGVNQDQVDWVKHFNTFLKELPAYIKNFHTTGVSWNPKGGDAASAKPSAGGAPSGGPPGAPPPPPAGFADQAPKPSKPAGGGDMSSVFGALNKGGEVTSGLKKVTDDMKTKNRTDKDKTSSVVPATSAKTTTEKAPAAAAKVKPSKFALDGNKWSVENFVGKKDIVIEETEPRHTVYIYGLQNSTVQIKGKVNSVAIDNCKRTAVVVENAISGVEVVNGTAIELQITGRAPSVAIDKTSGIQLYLSAQGLETEITTSKSSEMNVLFPGQDDLTELPIPEQYKTLIQNGKLVTETVQHSG